MQVIKNNFERTSCQNCRSLLQVEPEDIYVGKHGYKCWRCPCCGEENYTDESITLTADNIEYPTHFYLYGDGAKISDEELTKWVRECASHIDKDCDFWIHSSGDSFVLAYKSDEDLSEVTVVVAKNFGETEVEIPREMY